MDNNVDVNLSSEESGKIITQITYQESTMNLASDPLSELANAKTILIKEEIEQTEILTKNESRKRYNIYFKKDDSYIFLFKCKEESPTLHKCCSGPSRQFKMKVKHIFDAESFTNDIFDDSNVYAEFDKPYKCSCCTSE